MIRIEIEPLWRFRREDNSSSPTVMLDLLNEIRVTGKITSAAGRTDLSYRHAWNLIQKWTGRDIQLSGTESALDLAHQLGLELTEAMRPIEMPSDSPFR